MFKEHVALWVLLGTEILIMITIMTHLIFNQKENDMKLKEN